MIFIAYFSTEYNNSYSSTCFISAPNNLCVQLNLFNFDSSYDLQENDVDQSERSSSL